MTAVLPALILPWCASFLLLRFCQPCHNWAEKILYLSISLGVALGLTSASAFIWVAAGGAIATPAFRIFDFIPWAVIVVILTWLERKKGNGELVTPVKGNTVQPLPGWLKVIFAVVLAFSLAAMFLKTYQLPYGGYDSFTTWNLYAIFHYRGGQEWARFLEIQFFSPNHYPQLVPLSMARIYSWQGNESFAGPFAMQLLLALATSGVLLGGLAILRGPIHGAIAAMLLLASKPFIAMPAQHMADGPVSIFMLASLACLLMALKNNGVAYYWLILCGLLAGGAAWTKDEGQLFLLVITMMAAAAIIFRAGTKPLPRVCLAMAAGSIPLLAVLIWFKLGYAPSGYLFSQPEGAIIEKLCDPGRYATVIKTIAHECLRFGEGVMPILFLALLLLWRKSKLPDKCVLIAAGCVILMLAGYGMVYVISPFGLRFQLRTALERHLLQLWPLVIMAALMKMRFPHPAGKDPEIEIREEINPSGIASG